MVGFTKLFSSITSSSIWNEDDKTRIVWITMLALAGPDGLVAASVGGLAHTARVSREDCEKALSVLQSPDPDSRSPEYEGRRIEKVEGGFLLLNYGKYREARSEDERRAYMREYMQNYRKKTVNKSKPSLAKVSRSETPLANAEAEERQKKKQTEEEEVAPLPISFSNTVMPDLPTWLLRVSPLDEWETDYWSKVWQREAKAGWKMRGGREILDWCIHQDSLAGYFRSANDERKAKIADAEASVIAPEEAQRREEAARARQAAIEQQVQSELRASLMQPRE